VANDCLNVFGSPAGEFVVLSQNGLGLAAPDRQRPRHEAPEARRTRRSLHWHDLVTKAHVAWAEHVDIRTIQLMLGHADIKQTQRYLCITDEELREAMTRVWERRRQLRAVSQ
jgi:hypothetical protein